MGVAPASLLDARRGLHSLGYNPPVTIRAFTDIR